MDAQIAVLIRRAAEAWQRDPDGANMIEAGIAIEKVLQASLHHFMLAGLPAHGSYRRPEKPFASLAMGELLAACFSTTDGSKPVVPIEYFAEAVQAGRPLNWANRQALQAMNRAIRVYSAHSKLESLAPLSITELSREERFSIVEAATGLAAELGMISPGDIEDIRETLGRELSLEPIVPPSPEPRGMRSRPGKPFTRFIGRQTALGRLVSHVELKRTPISIEGEGGYGKTALAWQATELLVRRGRFSAIAWLTGKVQALELDAIRQIPSRIRNELHILTKLCLSLNLPQSREAEAMKEDLASFFGRNATLVVIDNWEDFPPGTSGTIDWIAQHAAVIVTARPDAGVMAKEKLGPLPTADLKELFVSEAENRLQRKIQLTEAEEQALATATAGSPLAVFWIVEKLSRGALFKDCCRRLEAEKHHLLEYCYGDLVSHLNASATQTAQLLVASGGYISRPEIGAILGPTMREEGLSELARINVIIADPEEEGQVALTPLCNRYLVQLWHDSQEISRAKARLEEFRTSQDETQRHFRTGPVDTPALVDYNAAKQGGKVEPISDYARLHPKDPWGHFFLGLAERKIGSIDKAAEALDEAIRLAEKLTGISRAWVADIFREAAITRSQQFSYGIGLKYAAEAVRLNDTPGHILLLAELHLDSKQYEAGLPMLFDLVTTKKAFLDDRDFKKALMRIIWGAIRFPGRPNAERRLLVQLQAIAIVEPETPHLETDSRRCDFVTLLHAAARNSHASLETATKLYNRAKPFISPDCQVKIRVDGVEPKWIPASQAFEDNIREKGAKGKRYAARVEAGQQALGDP